jgi:hypothetical protein
MRKLIVGFMVITLVVSSFLILSPQDADAKVTHQIYFVEDPSCEHFIGVGISFFEDGVFVGYSYGCLNLP